MPSYSKENKELWPISFDEKQEQLLITIDRESSPFTSIMKWVRFVFGALIILFIVVLVWSLLKSSVYPQELRNIAIQNDIAEIQYSAKLFGEWIKNLSK